MYSFVARLSRVTIDHASLARRSFLYEIKSCRFRLPNTDRGDEEGESESAGPERKHNDSVVICLSRTE